MKNGMVFAIEEFSVYDGPGIRTTVFLKGCPLRCMWCHNPEGQGFGAQVIRSPNGCLECGSCLRKGEEVTGAPCLVEESISVCPRRLIRKCGEMYTAEALIGSIAKNADLLNAAGGGVTFSGGEPLAQAKFLLACLNGLEGITHRALQTTGFAEKAVFAEVLDRCDYVLYDLKFPDEAAHRYYTGVSNQAILENFRVLAGSGKDFCVRMPLIPGVTDTADNARAAAAFLKENGVHNIELLPYNKMAGSKYQSVGRVYAPEFDEQADVCVRYDIFESEGIEVRVL